MRSNAGFLVAERFTRAVFGKHPAATIVPTEASVDAMTPELLAKWHHERYVPQNAILGISGDVDTKALLVKLKTWLGGWAKTDLKPEMPPNPTAALGHEDLPRGPPRLGADRRRHGQPRDQPHATPTIPRWW